LKDLPSKYIYTPWEAPTSILDKAGVKLGKNYPRPLVDHSVVSKENMTRMKQAYDDHKAREAAAAPKEKPSKKKQRTS
jgi:cryptochrome